MLYVPPPPEPLPALSFGGFADDEEATAIRLEGIWDLLAYCGRYGHQGADFFMVRPLQSLSQFAAAVGRRLDKESAFKTLSETDG